MIPLILSIFSSTIIFVIFKYFDKFKIDTFQAIVFNYFTAAGIGFILYGNEWNDSSLTNTTWLPFVFISAFMFIGLFFIMGKSSQVNGVASTSIAVKMSMAISLILMMIGYSENLSILKITGITLAFIGVYLVSSPDKKTSAKANAAWMLILLFIGSGGLDFMLNYVQKSVLGEMTPSIFTALGLGSAGIIGSIILIVLIIQKKTKLAFKNILAGIILGIPNYFSIYLLLLSYRTTGWNDSTVLAITNVSVVLCSAVIGFIIFKENKTSKKIIGLIAAILAITTLYIAN
ncbi:MAG: EamA/RhaT family transporter [Crocinitomicaceae bacterium]